MAPRPQVRWSGEVLLSHPRHPQRPPRKAQVCRDNRGEVLLLARGPSFVQRGDTSYIIHHRKREIRQHIRHRPQPPIQGLQVARDTLLGRKVLVVNLLSPDGQRNELWIDTTLDLVLRTRDPMAPGGGRQFLSIRPGVGCPPQAFALPAGYAIRSSGADRDRHAPRPTQVASYPELALQVGFKPAVPRWIPPHFAMAQWIRIDGPQGRAAQVVYRAQAVSFSVFSRPGKEGFGPCEDEEDASCPPPPPSGERIVTRWTGTLGVAVVGNLTLEDLRRIAASIP